MGARVDLRKNQLTWLGSAVAIVVIVAGLVWWGLAEPPSPPPSSVPAAVADTPSAAMPADAPAVPVARTATPATPAAPPAAPLPPRVRTAESLSAEERRFLLRGCEQKEGQFRCGSCVNDSDCPEHEGCVFDPTSRQMGCAKSECRADADCKDPERPSCLPAFAQNMATAVELIRQCQPAGTTRLGQECDGKSSHCTADLVCVFGICSVPCSRENDPVCPKGAVCEDDGGGTLGCNLTCEATGCPDGYDCGKSGACTKGPDCFTDPALCGPREKCSRSGMGLRWTVGCVEVCEQKGTEQVCSAGKVCGAGRRCYQACDMAAQDCPRDTVCSPVDDDQRTFGYLPLSH